MNYMTYVKQWRQATDPTMKWSDAVSKAKKDYYAMKEGMIDTLYTKQSNVNIERIYNALQDKVPEEYLEFVPSNKKNDKTAYLGLMEKIDKDKLGKIKKLIAKKVEREKEQEKEQGNVEAMNEEIQALMDLPTSYRDEKLKQPRAIGIKKVGRLKKNIKGNLKAESRLVKSKGLRGITKKDAKSRTQIILAMNRMKKPKNVILKYPTKPKKVFLEGKTGKEKSLLEKVSGLKNIKAKTRRAEKKRKNKQKSKEKKQRDRELEKLLDEPPSAFMENVAKKSQKALGDLLKKNPGKKPTTSQVDEVMKKLFPDL